MKIFKVEDKSKAVCEDCKALVSTTFMLRNVPFLNGRGLVKQLLAGVCDHCDSVVSISHQSAQFIKKANEAREKGC